MAKIELLLGGPATVEREDEIEEVIYELDINMESAVILRVKMLIKWVNSTTKCNFDKCLVAKDVLVSKASRPASQSSHDLSTP